VKKIIVALALVAGLSACSNPPAPVDPAIVEKHYMTCLEQGGSFSSEDGGFSCTITERS